VGKRDIKIAVFHLAFVYSGGGEKLVLEEVQRLKKRMFGVDLFACAIDEKKCFPELLKKQKINLFLPWSRNLFKGHDAFWVLLTCILAPFFAYKFKDYDVIFAANQPSLWIASVVKKLFKIPFIAYVAQPTRFLHPRKIDRETGLHFVKSGKETFTVKFMNFFITILNILDKFSFKSADCLLANGEYIKERIEKVYDVKAINCPAGADFLKKVLSDSKKLNNPYILMTNRHVWQKRLEYGLSVLSAVLPEMPDMRLKITGEFTEYTDELKILAKRLGLLEKIDFLGYLKEEKMQNLYKNALCYIYTAPEEDFGMGVIEAQSLGIPAVAWNMGGPSKVIISSKTGFLVPEGNVSEFIRCVFLILKNKNLRRKMSLDALNYSKKSFSWEKHINCIESNIKTLLK